MNVTVNRDNVTINLNLVFRENLTSLPSAHIVFDQFNSTTVKNPVEAAAQRWVPGARIQLLTGQIGTTAPTNSSKTWRLTENYTMIITGTNTNLGGTVESNLALLFLNTSQPMRVGTTEINSVGSEYLLAPFKSLETFQPKYFLGDAAFTKPPIPEAVTSRFSLWDLTWVPPISQWSQQGDVFSPTSTWTFSPDSPYNLTVATVIAEATILKSYVAILDPTIRLTAPARAWAQGSTLFFNLQTAYDLTMPSIVGSSLAALLGSVLVDRRLTNASRSRRRKR